MRLMLPPPTFSRVTLYLNERMQRQLERVWTATGPRRCRGRADATRRPDARREISSLRPGDERLRFACDALYSLMWEGGL